MRSALALSVIATAAACQKETEAPQHGLIYPHADNTTIIVGETVNFSDFSTRTMSRTWTFEGGSPSRADEKALGVQYNTAGTYTATLEVTYRDGATESESFQISVNEEYIPLVTVEGPTYVFYSEDPELPQDHPAFGLDDSGVGVASFISNAFEGSEAINLSVDPDASGTFAMLQTRKVGTADITEFRNGYLNLALKSTSNDPVHVRIEGGGAVSHAYVGAGDYGFERDGMWHYISIPMEDVLSEIDTEEGKMTLLASFDQFRLRNQTGEFNRSTFDFSADLIFFSNELPTLRE